MKVSIKLLATALMALTASTTVASALDPFDWQSGGQVKPRVTSIQMGIQSPQNAACPVQVPVTVWVRSNKPGTFPILIVSNNGVVLGPYQIETTTSTNNVTMGTLSEDFFIGSSVDVKYHVVTPHSTVTSNWVPLTVSC